MERKVRVLSDALCCPAHLQLFAVAALFDGVQSTRRLGTQAVLVRAEAVPFDAIAHSQLLLCTGRLPMTACICLLTLRF